MWCSWQRCLLIHAGRRCRNCLTLRTCNDSCPGESRLGRGLWVRIYGSSAFKTRTALRCVHPQGYIRTQMSLIRRITWTVSGGTLKDGSRKSRILPQSPRWAVRDPSGAYGRYPYCSVENRDLVNNTPCGNSYNPLATIVLLLGRTRTNNRIMKSTMNRPCYPRRA